MEEIDINPAIDSVSHYLKQGFIINVPGGFWTESTVVCETNSEPWKTTGDAVRANSSCDEMEIMFWWWLACLKQT